MNDESYHTKVGRLSAHGTVEEIDFYPEDRVPYRYAGVLRECVHEDASWTAAEFARLAVSVNGYLTMCVHDDRCRVEVAINRPLLDNEIDQSRIVKENP